MQSPRQTRNRLEHPSHDRRLRFNPCLGQSLQQQSRDPPIDVPVTPTHPGDFATETWRNWTKEGCSFAQILIELPCEAEGMMELGMLRLLSYCDFKSLISQHGLLFPGIQGLDLCTMRTRDKVHWLLANRCPCIVQRGRGHGDRQALRGCPGGSPLNTNFLCLYINSR